MEEMKFWKIKQHMPAVVLEDIPAAVAAAFDQVGDRAADLKGKTVGIAVGSRGISHMDTIVKEVVANVKRMGGIPTVFGAMGSHGNGNAEGQREMLASLGFTESTVGAAIQCSAEALELGTTPHGAKVYGNPLAFSFDRVILMNRIKPHTDFEDRTESGILKLLAIGIGNPMGAQMVHAKALSIGYGDAIRDAAHMLLEKIPVAFAIAITENWKHETSRIVPFLPEILEEEEAALLAKVKEETVRLPMDDLDVLLVQEAGKNISGTCVDTKVVGRICITGQKEPEKPKIRIVTVLDFTEESHGNAMGLGVVDLITRRAFDKIQIDATALTGTTSLCLHQAKIPCVARNDKEAVEVALRAACVTEPSTCRMAYIKNTNALEELAVSEAVYEELKDRPGIEVISGPFTLHFDENDALLPVLE